MNEPFRAAFETYEANGADFHAALAHCLAAGEVHSTKEYFLMGHWPETGVFFITMLAGNFRKCAADHAGRIATIRFAREFKGSSRIRQFNSNRFLNHGKRRHTSATGQ